MPLPVIPVAAGLATRVGLPVLLARAGSLAGRVFGSSGGAAAISAATARTGIAGGASRILNAMKNNKLMTALILMDLGTEGSELLSQLAAEDAEVAEMISRYGVTNDEPKKETVADLAVQADEMQCITDAANSVGGLKALHNLRRALGLSEESYKLYDQLRSLRNVVR